MYGFSTDCIASSLVLDRATTSSCLFFFLMIRRPPRSTLDRSSAASDVYKRQHQDGAPVDRQLQLRHEGNNPGEGEVGPGAGTVVELSLIHISEPTRPY